MLNILKRTAHLIKKLPINTTQHGFQSLKRLRQKITGIIIKVVKPNIKLCIDQIELFEFHSFTILLL